VNFMFVVWSKSGVRTCVSAYM